MNYSMQFAYLRKSICVCFLTAFSLILTTTVRGATTITGANQVIYDVVNDADLLVKISTLNASQFKELKVDLVIPEKVVDTAPGAVTSQPYTVVGISGEKAFQNTKISSISIEAPLTEIPNYTFDGCSNLTAVTIPETITKIGSYAFRNCSVLAEIGTLAGVTEIGSYAFYNCPALENITFGENLLTINTYAFQKCTGLTSVKFPDSLTGLNEQSFQGCTALRTVEFGSGLGEIGIKAFQTDTALETVTFKEGNKKIRDHCFDGCSSLKAPDFPSTLTEIEHHAFQKCTSLGELTLPANCTFGNYLFMESYISEIVWPSSIVSLGTNAFNKVSGLTSVSFPGCLAAVPDACFYQCPDLQTVTIAEGVTSIGKSVFRECPNLTNLALPSTLRNIGHSAFYECGALQDFDFPEVMDKIDYRAFYNCSSLENLKLPAGVTFGYDSTYGSNQFTGTDLTSITFPDDPYVVDPVHSIFGTQNNVEEMNFPGWMTMIPSYICSEWKGLKRVTIAEGTDSIGLNAFWKCEPLESVVLPQTTLRGIAKNAFYYSALKAIELPNTLETIDDRAFEGCKQLTAIELPSSLRYLGSYAFTSCDNLSSVIIRDGLKNINEQTFRLLKLTTLRLPETLERIGAQAFQYCKLPPFEFPSSLKYVGDRAFSSVDMFTELTLIAGAEYCNGAFASCINLSKINFPQEPCKLDDGNSDGIFEGCNSLTSVELPDWLTYIPKFLFNSCSKLASVTFSPETTEIGPFAFYECSPLNNIDFKSLTELTKIGAYAFSKISGGSNKFGPITLYEGCDLGMGVFKSTTVTEIIFEGCPKIGQDAFASMGELTKIKFPECMDTIPAGFCNGWTKLTDVTLPSTLKQIGAQAFKSCSQLKTLVLPEGLKEIADSAFYYSGLTSIEIPTSLTKIGNNAFERCNLAEFKFTDTPVEIGNYAFYYTSLQKIEIPRWMERVPLQTFKNCKSLTELTFEDRTKEGSAPSFTIESEAFSYCTALKTVNFPDIPIILGPSCFLYSGVEDVTFANPSLCYLTYASSQFSHCTSLESFTFPDETESVAPSMFSYSSKLKSVNLGKGVLTIGNEAFISTALDTITWSPVVNYISKSAFTNTKFTKLTIPGSVKTVHIEAFDNCRLLEELTLEDGVESLGQNSFRNCVALKGVTFPPSLRTVMTNCFNGCSDLGYCNTNEGLIKLDSYAFHNCTSLKELTFPSTVTTIGSYLFNGCSALESVVSHVHASEFGEKCFQNCKSLRRFESTDSVARLIYDCFADCENLEEFIAPEGSSVGRVCHRAFDGCKSLKSFPYLDKSQEIGENAFRNCEALVEMSLIGNQGSISYRGTTSKGMFDGCSHLQTLHFPNTDDRFKIGGADIKGAPLTALSFADYTGYKLNKNDSKGKLIPFDGATTGVIATPKTSTLVVKRGMKWKFEEAGYGKVFNIVEERTPEIRIEGDIFSTYDHIDDKNHYQAFIRWEVPLSDLNPNGETKVEVSRTDSQDHITHVADVVFSKPSEPIATSEIDLYDPQGNKLTLDADSVIVVKVTVDGHPNNFYGDYDFLSEDALGNPRYEMRYGYETPDLYFDAKTHRRVVCFEEYGYTSWFIMIDKFDSPTLAGGAIPDYYTYSARMTGYSYQKPYNYSPLELDEDGKLWSTKEETIEPIQSIDCKMFTAMALPTLDSNGFYTLDQIREKDTATRRGLTAILPQEQWSSNGRYTLGFRLDEELMQQKGYIRNTGKTEYIVNYVKVVDVTNPAAPDTITRYKLSSRVPYQTINLSNLTTVKPGHKYRTVTQSLFRGTFGSPVITIPDAPQLVGEPLEMGYADHFLSAFYEHDAPIVKATSRLYPQVTGMGYPDNSLSPEEYRLGVWRGLATTGPQQAQWYDLPAMAAATTDFLHHVDGPVGSSGHDCACADERSLDATTDDGETQLTYSDVFDTDNLGSYTVNYDHRIYVKVPSTMIPGDERWMLADLNLNANDTVIISGVENVSVDADPNVDPASVRYFDLQGRQVAEPLAGHTYLRVTSAGVSKYVCR